MNKNEVDLSALHTPEEMQKLSHIGHWVEGGLLATVAVIALLEALGFLRVQLIWQSVILVAGIFLIFFLLLHHGFDKLKLVWNLISKDAQQRQHLLMAFLLCVAGLSEIISKKYNVYILSYVWPVSLLIIGIMFLIHEQHGTAEAVKRAQTIHTFLGILLMLTFIIAIIGLLTKYRWTLFTWPALLLLISILLLVYKEPEGAYHQSHTAH